MWGFEGTSKPSRLCWNVNLNRVLTIKIHFIILYGIKAKLCHYILNEIALTFKQALNHAYDV